MLKDRREDAPKIVNIGVWATAVVGVFVFALTIGIGLYNTVNSPISASTSVASCPSGTKKIALNNYPTTYFTTKVDGKLPSHQPYESAMDNSWRCSEYCVPITSGETDQQAAEKFLTGATMGGKSVVIAKTEQSFLNMLQSDKANMVNTVILTSTKGSCQGAAEGSTSGASVDYPELKTKGATAPTSPVVKNETVKQVEEARKSAAELQAATEAGAQKQVGAPTGAGAPVATDSGDQANSPGANDLSGVVGEFVACKAVINERLTNANWIRKLGDRLQGFTSRYAKLKKDYPISDLTTVEKAKTALGECYKIGDDMKIADQVATATELSRGVVQNIVNITECMQKLQNFSLVGAPLLTQEERDLISLFRKNGALPENALEICKTALTRIAGGIQAGNTSTGITFKIKTVFYSDISSSRKFKPTTAPAYAVVYTKGSKTPIGFGTSLGHGNTLTIRTNTDLNYLRNNDMLIYVTTDGGTWGSVRTGMMIVTNNVPLNKFEGECATTEGPCTYLRLNKTWFINDLKDPNSDKSWRLGLALPSGVSNITKKEHEQLKLFTGASDLPSIDIVRNYSDNLL